MKKSWIIGISAIVCLGILLLIIILSHSKPESQSNFKEVLDMECLTHYAESYCKYEAVENRELEVANVYKNSFNCYLINDDRTHYYETTRIYYFLDEEIDNCKIIELKGGNN